MGKIVAIGGCDLLDKDSVPIVQYILSITCAAVPRVLFLPTASFDIEDDMPLLDKRFGEYGCKFDSLYLTDKALTYGDIEKKIMNADIIYAGGGNLKFLCDVWKSTGADKLMKKAYESGITLAGSSSGGMCWFESGYDDCGENGAYMFVECVGLLPYCMCPHFENPGWRSFNEAVNTQPLSGIGIDNDTALSYVDGVFGVVKADPENSAYLFNKDEAYRKYDLAVMPNPLSSQAQKNS